MIVFPDIEPILVEFLSTSIAAVDSPFAAGVRVGTVALPAGTVAGPEVIVTATYTSSREKVIRDATAVLDVYAVDVETASELAVIVAGLMPEIVGDPVKRSVVTLGPVRRTEPGPREKRSISVEFTVKGSEF